MKKEHLFCCGTVHNVTWAQCNYVHLEIKAAGIT